MAHRLQTLQWLHLSILFVKSNLNESLTELKPPSVALQWYLTLSSAVFCRPAGGDGEADEGEGGGPAAGGEGEHGPPEAGEAAGGGAGGTGQQGDWAGANPEHRERRPPTAGPSSGETAGEEPEVPRCESQRELPLVSCSF